MSRRPYYLVLGISTALALAGACSASEDGGSFDDNSTGDPSGSGGSSATTTTSDGVGGNFTTTTTGTGGQGTTCSTPAGVDDDGDGFSEDDGDCNDCDPNVSPGSIEVATADDGGGGAPEPADEDCDGTVDNVPMPCDSALTLTDSDPYHGAEAIELCQKTSAGEKQWGVLDAKYVRANGVGSATLSQVGIFDKFGNNVNPQGGSRMLAVSSGFARRPGDAGACNDYSCSGAGPGTPPPNFPQDVPNCAGDTSINDDVALELKIRSPKNATGYKFAFKFHSFEFPEYVCTLFNDQFIALVTPNPAGSINGNVSFDSKGNPVSVNVAYFDVCDPSGIGNFAAYCFSGCPAPPNPYCPLGAGELSNTGFETSWGEDAGGTSWLQTQAPITGGDEVTIRFAIWDTGDTAWDSTALVDNFEWIATGGTVAIGTVPVEDPK